MQILHLAIPSCSFLVSQSSVLTIQLGITGQSKWRACQFHWPHCVLQQLWMLDNVRCVCPYILCLKMDIPLHVHHSDGLRFVTSFTESDVYNVHENSSPNYFWFQAGDILYGDSARSNHACIISPCFQHPISYLFLQVVPLFTCQLYLLAYIFSQPKLWNAWGRGHERSVFWQLVSAYLRQPGGRQGKVLSTGATAATDLQYFLVGNWRKFVLVMFLF